MGVEVGEGAGGGTVSYISHHFSRLIGFFFFFSLLPAGSIYYVKMNLFVLKCRVLFVLACSRLLCLCSAKCVPYVCLEGF